MKKKILICSDVFPDFSGIARYMGELSKALKKKNNLTIICKKRAGEKVRDVIGGIKVKRVDVKDIDKTMDNAKGIFDKIIVGYYPFLLGALRNFEDVTYIVPSVRSVSVKYKVKGGSTTMSKEKAIEIEKEGMQVCDKIIYPSKYVQMQVQKDYKINKGIVIHHAVNPRQFKPGKKKLYDCITVANFNDLRKGIDILIPLMRNVDSNLIILGEGKLRKEYQNLIDKNNLNSKVKLLGKKESSKFIRESKILIMPSRCEAFGLVILEAMASGLPVIAYRPNNKDVLTASDELIKNGETGFLVENDEEMVEKINLLISNDNLRRKMGKVARKYAKKHSWGDYVKKFERYVNTKDMRPKVSVLMAVYNEEKYISEAIKSVLNQTMKKFELIIINDGSTDGTQKIAEEFAREDSRVRVINQKNAYKSAALNNGLKHAEGEYICLCDGDDVYVRDKLRLQSKFLDNHKNIDMIHSNLIKFNEMGTKKLRIAGNFKNDLRKTLKLAGENPNLKDRLPYSILDKTKKNRILGATVMIRRNVFNNVKFDEKLKAGEDYDLWFQIIAKGYNISRYAKLVYMYRLHENQITKNMKNVNQAKRRIHEKLKKGIYFR